MNWLSQLSWLIVSFLPVSASFSMDSTNVPTNLCRSLQSTDVDFPYNDCSNDLKLLPFSFLRRVSTKCIDNKYTTVDLESSFEPSITLINALIRYGVAIIDLGDTSKRAEPSSIPANVFASARVVMDQIHEPDVSLVCPLVPTDDTVDSAHLYGYHRTGGMISKRYNQFREGFVFSDSMTSFDVSLTYESSVDNSVGLNDVPPTFQHDCHCMFELLHDIANVCLRIIARHFQLPNDWFQQQYGPTMDHSQWHIKRYVMDESLKSNQDGVLLPTHSDPSLVSVVILDQPEIQRGAMGLQILVREYSSTDSDKPRNADKPNKSEWMDVPWSGHKVAIVFVGSVLQYVTDGYFMASKHRVIQTMNPQDQPRMAATLFCRPAPLASLVTPPNCPSKVTRIGGETGSHQSITFADWLKKTAKNYEKATAKKRSAIES